MRHPWIALWICMTSYALSSEAAEGTAVEVTQQRKGDRRLQDALRDPVHTPPCPPGYYDITGGQAYWWTCDRTPSNRCPGGDYTNAECVCACQPRPTTTATSTTITTRTTTTRTSFQTNEGMPTIPRTTVSVTTSLRPVGQVIGTDPAQGATTMPLAGAQESEEDDDDVPVVALAVGIPVATVCLPCCVAGLVLLALRRKWLVLEAEAHHRLSVVKQLGTIPDKMRRFSVGSLDSFNLGFVHSKLGRRSNRDKVTEINEVPGIAVQSTRDFEAARSVTSNDFLPHHLAFEGKKTAQPGMHSTNSEASTAASIPPHSPQGVASNTLSTGSMSRVPSSMSRVPSNMSRTPSTQSAQGAVSRSPSTRSANPTELMSRVPSTRSEHAGGAVIRSPSTRSAHPAELVTKSEHGPGDMARSTSSRSQAVPSEAMTKQASSKMGPATSSRMGPSTSSRMGPTLSTSSRMGPTTSSHAGSLRAAAQHHPTELSPVVGFNPSDARGSTPTTPEMPSAVPLSDDEAVLAKQRQVDELRRLRHGVAGTHSLTSASYVQPEPRHASEASMQRTPSTRSGGVPQPGMRGILSIKATPASKH
eukprot:CAMPEP_0178415692 /NCGR_PEP_ID=MMETSP0689_2-20121128/23681_1 /TAXON_ID=160604 /ORGANISM="Amphidinium massartii, Strain CS-259" /LENGTH=587 /DNA_ID=CAMNT_0020037017 /DNA_START=68 /DNA_END=1831 /DNA_ORIENTATION=-